MTECTGTVHLFVDCRDFRSGDTVVGPLGTYGEVTCDACRAVARRTL